MPAADFLNELSARGMTVVATGDAIKVSPKSKLTDADREAIGYFKPELIAILAATAAGDPDDRVTCHGCRHHQPGRCVNYRAAGLRASTVGPDLAAMRQNCPGFGARATVEPAPTAIQTDQPMPEHHRPPENAPEGRDSSRTGLPDGSIGATLTTDGQDSTDHPSAGFTRETGQESTSIPRRAPQQFVRYPLHAAGAAEGAARA